jgi:hypothetical protein
MVSERFAVRSEEWRERGRSGAKSSGRDGGRSAPSEFADVEIPVTAISDSDGFLFEFVNDIINVDVLWENVHEQISGTNCKDARSLVRTPKKGRFNSVHRGQCQSSLFALCAANKEGVKTIAS